MFPMRSSLKNKFMHIILNIVQLNKQIIFLQAIIEILLNSMKFLCAWISSPKFPTVSVWRKKMSGERTKKMFVLVRQAQCFRNSTFFVSHSHSLTTLRRESSSLKNFPQFASENSAVKAVSIQLRFGTVPFTFETSGREKNTINQSFSFFCPSLTSNL